MTGSVAIDVADRSPAETRLLASPDRSPAERCLPRRLRELRGGDARPRPARLHGRGGQFLEAADAAQHRQVAVRRHADVRGYRPDGCRLPAADRPDGRRDGLSERFRRQLLQLPRRRDIHRSAHRHLCAADRVELHPDPDDPDSAHPADESARVRLPRGPLVSRRRAERQRAVERQGRGARKSPRPGLRAGGQVPLANPGVRGGGVPHRGGPRDEARRDRHGVPQERHAAGDPGRAGNDRGSSWGSTRRSPTSGSSSERERTATT